MKCLFIGPFQSYATLGRVAAFAASGYKMYLINVAVANPYRNEFPIPDVELIADWYEEQIDPFDFRNTSRRYWRRCHLTEHLRNLSLLPEAKTLIRECEAIVSKIQPDFVVLHYGTISMHYARLFKRTVPNLPVLNIINVVPVNLNNLPLKIDFKERWELKWQLEIESVNYKKWLKKLDGVFYSSEDMQEYVMNRFKSSGKYSAIFPDFHPSRFFYKNQFSTFSNNIKHPSVIHLGAPEQWGKQIDLIENEILDFARYRIHTYSTGLTEKVTMTGYGHNFQPFDMNEIFSGKLADFANQFDAALITYNLENLQDRFLTTLPTRFFSAITACIPIVVKKGIFKACENFVNETEIGFSFTDSAELYQKLNNKELLARCRKQAEKLQSSINAEAQAIEIKKFIKHLFEGDKTQVSFKAVNQVFNSK